MKSKAEKLQVRLLRGKKECQRFDSIETYLTRCCFKYYDSLFLSFWTMACFANQSIGAVNTIVRRPTDGKLVGYNTDCEASITAIEDALRGTTLQPDASFPLFFEYVFNADGHWWEFGGSEMTIHSTQC